MDNLVTIFRIEDKNGMGMYGGQQLEDDKSLWGQCVNIFQENLSHPVPRDDGLTNLPFCYKYAFSSVEQLKDWVYNSQWLVKMAELGAVVKMLLIPFEYVWQGGHQVAYDPFEVVETIDFSPLEFIYGKIK